MTAARRLAPEAPPPFEPSTGDDRDLRWFFGLGPHPKKLTRPERERHARIAYALNGRGHALRLFYTRSKTEWTAWDAATLGEDARRALRGEYLAFATVAHRRGRPVPLEPHCIVPTTFVISTLTKVLPPEFELVERHGALRQYFTRAACAVVVGLDVPELLDDGTLEPGIWDGDIRISGRGARHLLRIRALVEIRKKADRDRRLDEVAALADAAAVGEIRERLAGLQWRIDLMQARYVESDAAADEREFGAERAAAMQNAIDGDYDEPDDLDAREAELARLWRTADAKVQKDADQVNAEIAGETAELDNAERTEGLRAKSTIVDGGWRPLEQHLDQEFTTVRELDQRFKVGVRFLRAELARCGRPTPARSKIPKAWLHTAAGKKFIAAIAKQYPMAVAGIKTRHAQKRALVNE